MKSAPFKTVDAHWTVKSDANGFEADVAGASFAEVDAAMQQAFGKPKESVAANLSGQPQRAWRTADIGVAVQLIGRPDGAEVICVRGMR